MIFQPPLKIQIEIKPASDQLMDGQIRGIKETGGCYTENCMDPGGLDMTGKVRILHLPGIQPVAGQSMD